MRLSLAMIVKDEAAVLGHCLESVRALVDEMVVVDTGSTDGTPDLARALGAQVHLFPWEGDFSAARNASLDHATGDWILVLDADEALDPLDHPRFRGAAEQSAVAAWRPVIRNYLLDGSKATMDTLAMANPGGYAEGAAFTHCVDSRMTRLFRRLPGVRFQGRLHEQVDPSFTEKKLPIRDLEGVIHHYGQTFTEKVQRKKNLYMEMARRDLAEHPADLQRHYNLVEQAVGVGAWAEAEAAAGAFLALARKQRQPVPPSILFTRAWALQGLGRHREAVAEFDRLLARQPGHPAGTLQRGISLVALGRGREAHQAFRACRDANPAFSYAAFLLADLEAALGDHAQARADLERGLEACPGDPVLWDRLVRLGAESGQPDRSVQDAWAAIQKCPGGGGGRWHQLVAVALLKAGAREEGLSVVRMGLEAFPDHPDLTRLAGLA